MDTIEREFGEQGRDQTIQKARDLSEEIALISCLALRTSIHCWESRSSKYRLVNWSESKLMIGNQAIGEEEGFNVGSDDEFHDLADDW